MELSAAQQLALQTVTVTASNSKIPLERVAVGQEIVAKVVSHNQAKSEVTLLIDKALVTAKTNLSLLEGQTIQLAVAQTGKQIVFKLPPTLIDTLVTQQALRDNLPKQKPVSETLAILQNLLKGAQKDILPKRISAIAQKIMDQLPTPKQLSHADGVKTAIKRSGVFFEQQISRLTKGSKAQNISHDIKGMLLRLKSVVTAEVKNSAPQSSRQNQPTASPTTKTTPPPLPSTTTKTPAPTPTPTPQAIKLLNESVQTSRQAAAPQNSTKPSAIPSQNDTQANKPIKNTADNRINAIADTLQNKKMVETSLEKKAIDEKVHLTRTEQAKIIAKEIQRQGSSGEITQAIKKITNQQNSITEKIAKILYRPINQPAAPGEHQEKPASINTKSSDVFGKRSLIAARNALNTPAPRAESNTAQQASRFSGLMEMMDNLVKTVDSALARTQLHQITSIQEHEGGRLTWSMEIPVKDNEELHLINLHLEKEPATDEDGSAVVTVNIAVDLSELGPVYARITLIEEHVGVVIWAEKQSSYELAREHLEELQTNLQKSGFKSEKIACHQGCPPKNRTDDNPGIDDNILDVKA